MADTFFDQLPTLRLNAWTGSETAPVQLDAEHLAWALKKHSPGRINSDGERSPRSIDYRDWNDPHVGWGLVLPDNDKLSCPQLATAADAPAAIQRLLAARPGSPVLRWRADGSGIGALMRFTSDGNESKPQLGAQKGIATHEVPHFLLIFAPPDQIPWAFQYAANLQHAVGRLCCLEDEALNNYIDALINDWGGSACDPNAPLLWSVDHGEPDITWLMDKVISQKLAAEWTSDQHADFVGATRLLGAEATREKLVAKLSQTKPALVVTTSHGMTGPLSNESVMTAQLGLPVDAARKALDLDSLCSQWQPDGAVWYAHACCSAGSDSVSAYEGLFDPASDVARTLKGVASNCGARIAPLPLRLLGAKRPLRAFIGHVEPTFDWTLRHPETGQRMTNHLIAALHSGLFDTALRPPIGSAMGNVFQSVGNLLNHWIDAQSAAAKGSTESLARALYYQISALDNQRTVILGDPTVALPALRKPAREQVEVAFPKRKETEARKALVVGIDYYQHFKPLKGCVNDAHAVRQVLQTNGDGSANFEVQMLTGGDSGAMVTRAALRKSIQAMFESECETALLYFAGHGHVESTGGYLLGSNAETGDDGLALADIMQFAAKSPAKNRMIILDSCFSGAAADSQHAGGFAEIKQGTTILAAAKSDQTAVETNGKGVFTELLVTALQGAAGNLLGEVTPGSVYAHIDKSLGLWGQRAVFKTNVSTFVSLRTVEPPIARADLLRIVDLFPKPPYEHQLDPTYEPERQHNYGPLDAPDPVNNEKFALLQKYKGAGLLVPVDAPHMWHAAMEKKTCRLTALGEHYRSLVESRRI